MKLSSYTQENESKGVNIISSDPAHVFHGYEAKKYNVASLNLELGQGRDPGVRSAPFVSQGEGVLSKQVGNVVSDNGYAKPDNVYAYQKIPGGSEIAKEQKVSENVTCVENAIVEKVLSFETDSSPSGHAVKVYDVCSNGVCSCVYNLSGDKTQLKPCRFAYILSLCTREGKETFTPLFHDVCDGLKIVDDEFKVSSLSYDCKNYLSVLTKENKPKMDKIIRNEPSEGFMKVVDKKPQCIHSLGAVPKPDGGIRPITDCSMPLHDSVNSHCENLMEEFKYKSVENVSSMLNKHDYLAVVDIKAAYRALSIYPDHRSLLGLRWNLDNKDIYVEDGHMCFGLRVGPMQFNKVSEFIYSILSNLYGIQIVNYLDDFIVVASSKEEAQWAQNMVINILRYVGFHISWAKVNPPSQVCRFLGLEIDSNEMEIRLPVDKLEKLKGLLAKYINKNSIGKKELESLGGLLSHCVHVVDGGKVYRFYDLYKVF